MKKKSELNLVPGLGLKTWLGERANLPQIAISMASFPVNLKRKSVPMRNNSSNFFKRLQNSKEKIGKMEVD